MAKNPYLFIVGCPRSGTTLLQRMLDHHPQLAVVNDAHFIPRVIEKHAAQFIAGMSEVADLPLTTELVRDVQAYHRFYRFGLSWGQVQLAAAKAHTYAEFVSELYSTYALQRGKSMAGEKTPDYARHLPLLHGLFPWVRSVHILRDGRDVALSTLEWAREDKGPGRFLLWRDEPVAVCALWWMWQVNTGRRDGTSLGASSYHEVKYEDLVAQPKDTLQSITDFLGVPFAPQMLAYHVGKTSNEPGISAKKAWLPPTPGLRDWRKQMRDEDAEVFESIAGDLLSALDYPRAFQTISPTIAARATRCKSWWESEMARREAKRTGSPVANVER